MSQLEGGLLVAKFVRLVKALDCLIDVVVLVVCMHKKKAKTNICVRYDIAVLLLVSITVDDHLVDDTCTSQVPALSLFLGIVLELLCTLAFIILKVHLPHLLLKRYREIALWIEVFVLQIVG